MGRDPKIETGRPRLRKEGRCFGKVEDSGASSEVAETAVDGEPLSLNGDEGSDRKAGRPLDFDPGLSGLSGSSWILDRGPMEGRLRMLFLSFRLLSGLADIAHISVSG